jgi:hypothetical protein
MNKKKSPPALNSQEVSLAPVAPAVTESFFDTAPLAPVPPVAGDHTIHIDINHTHFSVQLHSALTGETLRDQSVSTVLLALILEELRALRRAG